MTPDERIAAGLPVDGSQDPGIPNPYGAFINGSLSIQQPQFWRDEDGLGRDFYVDMQGRKFRSIESLNRANGSDYTHSDLAQASFSPTRGNAGHGSWLDQQGGDLIGDSLFAGAGYASGGASQLIVNAFGFGGDTAEGRRQDRAGALGGAANQLYGGGTNSESTSTSSTAGGSTDNYFGDYLTDPNTGDVTGSNSDPYGTGVDYSGNPTGQYADSTFQGDTTNTGYGSFPDSGPTLENLVRQYGAKVGTTLYQAYQKQQGKQTLGQSVLGQVGSDPLSAAFSATPFLLALSEANRQGGDINDTIGRMRTLEGSVAGNASPYMNAILDPYDMQTGQGRNALMQDQSLRGVRGSSFGDQSLSSYDYTRGVGRGDIASKALLGSAGLQGNLLNSELGAINARNTNRNLLLGAGLSASGRLFQPEQDPFNLKTLMGLT